MSATPTTLANLRGQNMSTERKPRTIIEMLQDDKVKQGLATVAGRLLSADRVMKLVTNAIYRTPTLALCEPKTVLGALMASVSLGLEPNTPQGHAYLIPYKRRALQNNQWVDVYECQFQIGYRGLIVLGYRSPRIKSIEGEAIRQGDHFKHMKGSQNFLEHQIALTDRGDLIGAYCHSHMEDGQEISTVMPLDRILSVRDRSETFKALEGRLETARRDAEAKPRDGKAKKELEKAQRNYDETPWVLRFDEMAAKTAIKRHCTAKMPLDPGDFLRAAVELDNAGERGVIDLSALADPDATHALVHDGEIPREAIIDGEAEEDAGEETGPEPQGEDTPQQDQFTESTSEPTESDTKPAGGRSRRVLE